MSPSSATANAPAAILEAGGVHTLGVGQALDKVRDALSKKSSGYRDLYAVVIYDKDELAPANNARAWNAVFRAYWKGWRKLAKVTSLSLTHPDQDRLTAGSAFSKQDFGDICIYWSRGSTRDETRHISAVPGVYFLPSHLDAECLGLPAFPEVLREDSVIIQVKRGRSRNRGVGSNEWNPWDTLAQSVAEEGQQFDKEIQRDSIEWRKRFMSENECWSSAQIAKESGSNARNRAASASRWVADKKIFSVPYEGKTWFPRFQFQHGRPIPAVSKIIGVFPDHATGWDLAYFFTAPNTFIGGRRPLELLKDDPKRLESLAKTFTNPANAF